MKNEMCSSNLKLYMVLSCYSHIQASLKLGKKNFITSGGDKEQERITRAVQTVQTVLTVKDSPSLIDSLVGGRDLDLNNIKLE